MSSQEYHHSGPHHTDENAGLLNDISSYAFQALLHSGSAYRASSSHVFYGPTARQFPHMPAQPGVTATTPYSAPIRSQVTRHSILTYDEVGIHEYDLAGNPHRGIAHHPQYLHFSPVIARQEAPRPVQQPPAPPPPQPQPQTQTQAPQLSVSALPTVPTIPVMSGRNRKRHASEKALAELKPLCLAELKEDEVSCIICMEDYVEVTESTDEPKCEHALQMACGHVFGSYCLKLWLKGHSTCPTCRREVDYVEEDERAAAELIRRRNHHETRRHRGPTLAERQTHSLVRRRMAVQSVDYSTSQVTRGQGWFVADSERREQVAPAGHCPPNNGVSDAQALADAHIARAVGLRGRSEAGDPPPQEGQALFTSPPPPRPGAGVGLLYVAPLFQQSMQNGHQTPSPMPQRSQSVRQPLTHQRHHSDVNIGINRTPMPPTPPERPISVIGPGDNYRYDLRDFYNHADIPAPTRSPMLPRYVSPDRMDRPQRMFSPPIAHVQQQQQQQQHQIPYGMFNDGIWLPAPILPAAASTNDEEHIAAPPSPTTAIPQQQHQQQQCDLLDIGFCIHHYYGAGSAGSSVEGQAGGLVMTLSCGHVFHEICLVSTTKARGDVNYPRRNWWCTKCGRFETPLGSIHNFQWSGVL